MDQFYLSVTSDFKKRLITKLVPREPDFDEELVDGIISTMNKKMKNLDDLFFEALKQKYQTAKRIVVSKEQKQKLKKQVKQIPQQIEEQQSDEDDLNLFKKEVEPVENKKQQENGVKKEEEVEDEEEERKQQSLSSEESEGQIKLRKIQENIKAKIKTHITGLFEPAKKKHFPKQRKLKMDIEDALVKQRGRGQFLVQKLSLTLSTQKLYKK